MRFLQAFAVTATLFTMCSVAHADFFDVVKKVGQVADAVNTTQAIAEGRADPTDVLKGGGIGGGKHGSHGGKHKK